MCALPQWHVFSANRRYDCANLQAVRSWTSCVFARLRPLRALSGWYTCATRWYARLPEVLGGGFPVCRRWQHMFALPCRDILACHGGVGVHSLPRGNGPAIAWRLCVHSLQCVLGVQQLWGCRMPAVRGHATARAVSSIPTAQQGLDCCAGGRRYVHPPGGVDRPECIGLALAGQCAVRACSPCPGEPGRIL